MVITVLEARVAEANWPVLEENYRKALDKPLPSIVQTVLVRSISDPTLWRIMTTWRSRKDLDEMRRSTATPTGVLVVRSAGAEPTLSVFDVVVSS